MLLLFNIAIIYGVDLNFQLYLVELNRDFVLHL